MSFVASWLSLFAYGIECVRGADVVVIDYNIGVCCSSPGNRILIHRYLNRVAEAPVLITATYAVCLPPT